MKYHKVTKHPSQLLRVPSDVLKKKKKTTVQKYIKASNPQILEAGTRESLSLFLGALVYLIPILSNTVAFCWRPTIIHNPKVSVFD